MKECFTTTVLESFFFVVGFLTTITANGQQIAAGMSHSLAVCNDGSVLAWGDNRSGELGNGTISSSVMNPTPKLVPTLNNVIAVSAGGSGGLNHASYFYSLALKDDGSVWMWGNSNGLMGSQSYIPIQVNGLNGIKAISAGTFGFALALDNNGTIWAWGDNSVGQLGPAATNVTSSTTPYQISPPVGGSITAISAGGRHGLALNNDGTVWTWGNNDASQLGNNANDLAFSPNLLQVPELHNIVAIAAGNDFSIALDKAGNVWAWGDDTYNELADQHTTSNYWQARAGAAQPTPQKVPNLSVVTAIAAGEFYSLALQNNGTIMAWGRDDTCELCESGNQAPPLSYSGGYQPVPVQGPSNSTLGAITAIYAGSAASHSFALSSTSMVAWGDNACGDLGSTANSQVGNPICFATPVQGLCTLTLCTGTPQQPESISGKTTVCPGLEYSYSINAVAGADYYTWTLPTRWSGSSTTTSITVTAGQIAGQIVVIAHNSCGNSQQSLTVSIGGQLECQNHIIPGQQGAWQCPGWVCGSCGDSWCMIGRFLSVIFSVIGIITVLTVTSLGIVSISRGGTFIAPVSALINSFFGNVDDET